MHCHEMYLYLVLETVCCPQMFLHYLAFRHILWHGTVDKARLIITTSRETIGRYARKSPLHYIMFGEIVCFCATSWSFVPSIVFQIAAAVWFRCQRFCQRAQTSPVPCRPRGLMTRRIMRTQKTMHVKKRVGSSARPYANNTVPRPYF